MLTKSVSAQVVVAREVRQVIGTFVARKGGTFLFANVLVVSASELDPLGKVLEGLSEAFRRVRHDLRR